MAKKSNPTPPEREPAPRRYEIELTRAAERGLASIPKADLRWIDARIRALGDDPHPRGSRKLEGEDDLYRVRAGDYRIVYRVEADRLVVVVVKIGNRKDIYRD